jgi:hypothetical protein
MSDVDLDTIFEHRERVRKPGWQKAMPWLAGALLIAGVIALLIVKFANTGHTYSTPLTNKPAQDFSQNPATVKLPPAAMKTARDFIRTAVARQNLRAAYALSGPQIRQGQTLKEWMTGNIAVIPYPVAAIDYAPMKIDFSYPREAQIEVALLPKKSAHVRSALFILDLIKDKNGKWLVNAWVPRMSPPVPNGSQNNGAGQ